jgi:tetratricopeptide (TPR) repeat protein
MTWTRLGASIVGVLACAWVSTASAQESAADRAARAHFEAARLHFDRGAYEEAQREFTAAYELSQRAELLYNLYLTAERLADFDAAIAYLDRYLTEGAPDEERRSQLTPRLENLRERRARTAPEGPPAEEAPPDPEPAATSASHPGDLVPAAITFGIAGAGLLTFAVFGGLALAEDDALGASCGVRCSDAQLGSLGTYTLVADIGWITGLLAAAVGTVLVLTVGMPTEDPVHASIVPFLSLDGGGLSALGVF